VSPPTRFPPRQTPLLADWHTDLSVAQVAERRGVTRSYVHTIWGLGRKFGLLPAERRARDGGGPLLRSVLLAPQAPPRPSRGPPGWLREQESSVVDHLDGRPSVGVVDLLLDALRANHRIGDVVDYTRELEGMRRNCSIYTRELIQ
jgi:hypothetical protein